MAITRRPLLFLLAVGLAASSLSAAAQTLLATVDTGTTPVAAAANRATNQIYTANYGSNNVTVIDGATDQTSTVAAGQYPYDVRVNPLTNKIYVSNFCGNDSTCQSNGTVTVIDGATHNTVTVIDGATNNTSTVNVDLNPAWLAVNQVTNQIYVANSGSNTVTVIDGATMNPTSVTVGNSPYELAVDPVTDKIYVANYTDGTMTMIDGATNNTTTIAVGNSPGAIEANVVTNKVYVPNQGDNTVSVILGASAAPLQFVAVTPCRLVDTRNANGEFGGPPITGGTSRSFPIPQQTTCNIPSTAASYSLNVTLVPIQNGPVGYLTIWPTGEDQPLVSTMNSLDGRIKANAAIMPGCYQGAVSVYVTNTTNVVLDIDGYFAAPSGQTQQFYPLTPCRVLDTRKPNGDLGGPFLNGGQERDFPVLESTCNIPNSAQAYSMNFTVVPVQGQPLGYLTVWPTGQSKPLVSTLNNLTATIVANAAIVPAGSGGEISVYPSNNTNLVVHIAGYLALAGQGGLSLYPAVPCRVIDTRKGNGAFSGELTVDVVDSVCAPPSTAQAYVFNATVVPVGSLGYLTLWPDSEQQPMVSTLNAIDGAITSNMAIVPNINGKVDAYASGITQLVLDVSSYFAP